MYEIKIVELKSNQNKEYKEFFIRGLIEEEDNFRMTPTDDIGLIFPTKDTQDSFTLGAYIDNKLVGVASFERDGAKREKLRHKGILFRMYVTKELQGKNIGKDLIINLIERVRLLDDIEQINLTVIANNPRAIHVYEKFGFRTFASEENAVKWKGKYFTENQMVLKLKEQD
ncbi:MAG: GNAT family N-acetyltransferase [Arachidicoccus sp.]|nr:GNAT family N-acetyltransferase [Arachidicoccus sp.]